MKVRYESSFRFANSTECHRAAFEPDTLVLTTHDEAEASAPSAGGPVTYLRAEGRSTLSLATPVTLNEKAELAPGPAVELQERGGLLLSGWGSPTSTDRPAGRPKRPSRLLLCAAAVSLAAASFLMGI